MLVHDPWTFIILLFNKNKERLLQLIVVVLTKASREFRETKDHGRRIQGNKGYFGYDCEGTGNISTINENFGKRLGDQE